MCSNIQVRKPQGVDQLKNPTEPCHPLTSCVSCWRAGLIWWKCCLGARHCNTGNNSSLKQQI
eukprot:7852702-Ditylum_brightwellii.AAC.1